MKSIVLALASIAVLAVGIAFAMHRGNQGAPAEPAPAAVKTYENAAYGYSLSYPATLDIQEYLPEDVVFGHIDGDMVEGVAEARVVTVEGKPGRSFAEAAADQFKNLCAADGPTGSLSCVGLKSADPFTTDTGVSGWRIVLIGEMTRFGAGTTTTTQFDKGPYYAFVATTSALATSAIVIHAPLNQSLAEADTATIEAIAKSLAFER
jgi:hypothetical protein